MTNIDENKEKKKDFRFKVIKFIIYLIYFVIIFFFLYKVYLYSENNQYEDDDVIIKEMSLGYNVYNKKGNLKEVNFFNGNLKNNKELLSYINNNILLSSGGNIDNNNVFILKNPTTMDNITQINQINNIYIKKIYKIDMSNFIVLYTEYFPEEKKYKYCFTKNNLNFNIKADNFCILKTDQKYDFIFATYRNNYMIGLNDKMYIFDNSTMAINMIVETGGKIINISKNKNDNIKVINSKGVVEILGGYIDYFLIKKIQDNIPIMHINISQLL